MDKKENIDEEINKIEETEELQKNDQEDLQKEKEVKDNSETLIKKSTHAVFRWN